MRGHGKVAPPSSFILARIDTLPFTPVSQKNSPNGDPVCSPCIGVCSLGPGNLCIGCLRSAEEIGNWLNYSSHQRSRIMSELPARLPILFAV